MVFRNPENEFVIARLAVGSQEQTIKGMMPGVEVGDRLRLQGHWVTDPRYGRQFAVESYLPVLPETAEGLERYLAGQRVQGIGRVVAKRIVAHFGDSTLKVLDEHPERLLEVEGIGPGRLGRVIESWRLHRGERDAVIFLQGLGLSAALAEKIFRAYRSRSIDCVKRNPYRLVADIRGVGFVTADRVAERLGVAGANPHRIRAGLLHCLVRASESGHCYLPEPELADSAAGLLSLDAEALDGPLRQLILEGAVVAEADRRPRRLWLWELHALEVELAEALLQLRRSESARAWGAGGEQDLGLTARVEGVRWSPAQRAALQLGLRDKFCVVTGGPGTGKTTLVRALLSCWQGRGAKVALAAPTGRAARRLEEATGHSASTLHRLLEYSPASGEFQRHADQSIGADVVIVDEVSMVDLALMTALIRALRPQAQLILVGDAAQLPSVGPGRVLGDLIDSGVIPLARLDVVFRQDEAGLIVANAHRILDGQRPQSAADAAGDFFFIERDQPEAVLRTVVHLVTERIPRRWGLDGRRDVQVLAPMRKGSCGVEALNNALRERMVELDGDLRRGQPEVKRDFGPGDRVMQQRNNYDKEVFNGDVGQISSVAASGDLVVLFGEQRVEYSREEQDQLQLAYAVTIHKSQGSEYPAVVVPVLTQHFRMLQRNLLYTAVTRGKEVVVLVGSRRALDIALGNSEARVRYTGLAERLRAGAAVP